jgi:hypothetical protein
MDGKAPVALAIGIGYVLGRKHKLRWALILGGAAATGQLGGLSNRLLSSGTDLIQSTPELAKFAESTSRLLSAGRSAAMSAMNSKVDALEKRTQLTGALPGKRDQSQKDQSETDESEEDEYEDDDYDEPEETEPEDTQPEDEEPRAARRGRSDRPQREPAVRRVRR